MFLLFNSVCCSAVHNHHIHVTTLTSPSSDNVSTHLPVGGGLIGQFAIKKKKNSGLSSPIKSSNNRITEIAEINDKCQ